MVTGRQGVTYKAKNQNAKYKITTTKSQSIKSDGNGVMIKYSYSRLIKSLLPVKYSYAIWG